MLEVTIAAALGLLAGIFTGLFPGIHINLVSSSLPAFYLFLIKIFSPLALVVFIVSMSVTHIFFDFIPSVYFGAPDDSGLATMPGHSLLLEGKGHEAICLALFGAYISIIVLIFITPLFILILPAIYPFFERMMAWLLTLSLCFMIYHEKGPKIYAIFIIILAGFLGLASLSFEINQPLLPLLSGLFGSSTLIFSLSQKTKIPPQDYRFKFNKREFVKPLLPNFIISPVCSFLPGMGGSQAAIISSEFSKPSRRQFLILLGSVSAIVMVLSLPVLFVLNKARTGSAAAIQEIMKVSGRDLIIILAATFIISTLAFFLAKKCSILFAKKITVVPYSVLSGITLFILSAIVIYFSGPLGFAVYISGTLIGLLTIYLNVRKGHLMACLLIPTIIFYL